MCIRLCMLALTTGSMQLDTMKRCMELNQETTCF